MTQFLLWTSIEKPPDGFEAKEVCDIDWLQEVAVKIFPDANAIVKVSPIGDELDGIVDEAREKMLEGMPVESTLLGILLKKLASRSNFALFWGDDYQDIPVAYNIAELWDLLGPQIITEQGNWELYLLSCLRREQFLTTRLSGRRTRRAAA